MSKYLIVIVLASAPVDRRLNEQRIRHPKDPSLGVIDDPGVELGNVSLRVEPISESLRPSLY